MYASMMLALSTGTDSLDNCIAISIDIIYKCKAIYTYIITVEPVYIAIHVLYTAIANLYQYS